MNQSPKKKDGYLLGSFTFFNNVYKWQPDSFKIARATPPPSTIAFVSPDVLELSLLVSISDMRRTFTEDIHDAIPGQQERTAQLHPAVSAGNFLLLGNHVVGIFPKKIPCGISRNSRGM